MNRVEPRSRVYTRASRAGRSPISPLCEAGRTLLPPRVPVANCTAIPMTVSTSHEETMRYAAKSRWWEVSGTAVSRKEAETNTKTKTEMRGMRPVSWRELRTVHFSCLGVGVRVPLAPNGIQNVCLPSTRLNHPAPSSLYAPPVLKERLKETRASPWARSPRMASTICDKLYSTSAPNPVSAKNSTPARRPAKTQRGRKADRGTYARKCGGHQQMRQYSATGTGGAMDSADRRGFIGTPFPPRC